MEKQQLTLELVFEQVKKDSDGVIENATVTRCTRPRFHDIRMISLLINLTPTKTYTFDFFTDDRMTVLTDYDYLKMICESLNDMENKANYWEVHRPKMFQQKNRCYGMITDFKYTPSYLRSYQPQFTKAANVLKKYLSK